LEKEGFAVVRHEAPHDAEALGQNDQMISMKVDKKHGRHHYSIKVHHNKEGAENVIYHDNFALPEENKIPDFTHKLFDLTRHLNVVGTVRKIDGNEITLKTTVNTHLLEGRKIRLYKKSYMDKKFRESYGTGRVIKVDQNTLVVRAEEKTTGKVSKGDIGVIISNDNED
jgi:hypothetical protein